MKNWQGGERQYKSGLNAMADVGVELDWAEDGQICLDMFQKSPAGYYDAILTDIRMPHMTGDEATCLESGMTAHIAKPIDVIELKRLLKRYLI